jgi:hypothetical protein
MPLTHAARIRVLALSIFAVLEIIAISFFYAHCLNSPHGEEFFRISVLLGPVCILLFVAALRILP